MPLATDKPLRSKAEQSVCARKWTLFSEIACDSLLWKGKHLKNHKCAFSWSGIKYSHIGKGW